VGEIIPPRENSKILSKPFFNNSGNQFREIRVFSQRQRAANFNLGMGGSTFLDFFGQIPVQMVAGEKKMGINQY
jgi:hypothetical protein